MGQESHVWFSLQKLLGFKPGLQKVKQLLLLPTGGLTHQYCPSFPWERLALGHMNQLQHFFLKRHRPPSSTFRWAGLQRHFCCAFIPRGTVQLVLTRWQTEKQSPWKWVFTGRYLRRLALPHLGHIENNAHRFLSFLLRILWHKCSTHAFNSTCGQLDGLSWRKR